MKLVLKWILTLVNLGLSLLLIGAVLSMYVNSNIFWPLAFLGLGFPVLVIVNFLFLIYWLIRFKKPLLISLIALFISVPSVNSSFRLFKKELPSKVENSFSIMTYNVRLFDVFNWSGKEKNGQNLIKFLGESKTDIICLQEYMENNSESYNHSKVKDQLSHNPYSYINYNYQAYKRKHGLAIFSKFPIIGGDKGNFPGTRNMFIYADVKLPDDTIRIFNAHLESIHLDYQQYNLIDSLNLAVDETTRTEVKRIIKNVKKAYINRIEQVYIIREVIDNSPYPVVICGDFNDTPVSFTYKNIRKNFKDTFVGSGKGMGTSYQEFVFPLRIDYILHDPEIQSGSHTVIDVDYSDHKPVMANLWFKD